MLQLLGDVGRARAELHGPRLKLMALTAVQLRSAVKAMLLAPFTLPAALAARWQALFAGSSYQNFLLSEGEAVWAWRNRTENERWFWEVFAIDRWACWLVSVGSAEPAYMQQTNCMHACKVWVWVLTRQLYAVQPCGVAPITAVCCHQ